MRDKHELNGGLVVHGGEKRKKEQERDEVNERSFTCRNAQSSLSTGSCWQPRCCNWPSRNKKARMAMQASKEGNHDGN